MSRPTTESKYSRRLNSYLLAASFLLAWAPTLPAFINGVNQTAAAQNDPIEPPPSETPRNPTPPAVKPPAPAPKETPAAVPPAQPTTPPSEAPSAPPAASPDDLSNSSTSQPAT